MRLEYNREGWIQFWICRYFGFVFSWAYWKNLFKDGVFDVGAIYIQPCLGTIGVGVLNFGFGIVWSKENDSYLPAL